MAYLQHGVTVDEFEEPRYRRIDHIKQLMAAGEVDASLRRKAPADIQVQA